MGTPKKEQYIFLQALCNALDLDSGKFVSIYRIVFNEKTLFTAYCEIAKKKSCFLWSKINQSFGLRAIYSWKLKRVVEKLKFSKYKVSSPKKILKDSLSLTIIPILDRVVVHSIYMILLWVLQGIRIDAGKENSLSMSHRTRFSFCSSTQNKSVHFVLFEMQTWTFCSWLIKLKIDKLFNQMNKIRFFNILREVVESKDFFSVISHIIKIDFFVRWIEGVDTWILKSNLFGFLLANVYFYKFDEFVKIKLKRSLFKSSYQKIISVRLKKHWRFTYLSKSKLNKRAKKSKNNTIFKDLGYPKILHDEAFELSTLYVRIYYVRYLSHIMFGVRGFKNTAFVVIKECFFFIKYNLNFDLKVMRFYNLRTSKVEWLNFKILNSKVSNNKNSLCLNTKKKMFVCSSQNVFGFFFKKNMFLRVDELLAGLARKVFLNKAVSQVGKESIVNIIVTAIKSIFLRNTKKGLRRIPYWNTRTQKFISKRYLNILIESKYNWAYTNELKKAFGQNLIVQNSLYSLKRLSYNHGCRKPKIKKKIFYRLHHKNAKEFMFAKSMRALKQNSILRFFISQRILFSKMRLWGMVNLRTSKPVVCHFVLKYNDIQIVEFFKSKATNLLHYYRLVVNYSWLKTQVNYRMRRSLLCTIAKKHKKSLKEVVRLMGRNASIFALNNKGNLQLVNRFWTSAEINSYSSGPVLLLDFFQEYAESIQCPAKIFVFKAFYQKCYFINCFERVCVTHSVKLLFKKIKQTFSAFIFKKYKRKMFSFKSLAFVFGASQISLCDTHNLALYQTQLSLNNFKGR